MEETVLNYLLQQWVAVVLLALIGYLLTRYFMNQIDKKDLLYQEEIKRKDAQNQSNLDRYIDLTEKAIWVMSSLWWLKPKLDEIHDDIRRIRDR